MFHRAEGPAHWAKAKLVRYADDFVVLARYVSPKLSGFIETKLESWMGLEINREKTQVIDLKQKGARLDFLGFTFRYEPDHFWSRTSVSACGAVEEGCETGEGEAARADQRSGSERAYSCPDRYPESTSERLGQLLSLWLSPSRSRPDQ